MNARRNLRRQRAQTGAPRWRRSLTAIAVLALSATFGFAASRTTAQAALSNCSTSVAPPCIFAGFEIDGDTAVNGGALDWQSSTVTGSVSYTTFTDPANTTADNIMSNGSKESDQTTWSCVTSKPPSKSDIVSGAIWFQTLPPSTGHQFIYGDFTRFGVNGDVHFDYEFNRATSDLTGSCSSLPLRAKGDVLITFDTSNGGSIIFVSAFTWSCPTSGGTSKVCTGAGSWAQSGGLVQGGTFVGTANLPPASTDAGVTPGAFGEASLDLTATVGSFTCNEFGSAFMHSRSAGTSDIANGKAEIKDYVTPVPFNPGGCPNSGLSKAQRDHTTNPTGAYTQDTSSSPLIVNPGDTLDYKLTYTNTGAGAASNVTVSDSIPAGTAYVASSCNLSCTPVGSPVTSLTWNLGTQNGGASVNLTFQVTVNSTGSAAGPVTIENFGTVTATGESPPDSNHVFATVTYAPSSGLAKAQADVQPLNLYCNSAASGGSVTSNTSCASLPGTLVSSPTFVQTAISATPGDVIEYQLTYTNSGNSPATTVVISDGAPTNTSYVAGSAACDATCTVDDSTSTIKWTYASVGVGVTKHVTFQVTLASAFAAGSANTVTNSGFVKTDQEPLGVTSNTVTANITATGQLAIVKSASVSGGQITYTISWFNTGNGNLTGQIISDTIPAGLKFVSCGGLPACAGGVVGSGGTVSWTVAAAAGTTAASPAGTVTLVLGT